MKKENIHIDWELVSSILSNQADDSEKELFKSWISGSGNKELFNQIEKIWQETGDISYCYNVITNEAWEKVAAQTIHVDKPKTRSIIPTMLKVAASIALLITLSWIYMENRYEKVVAKTEQVLDYQLPDGSLVSLNTHSKLRFKKGLAGSIREIWMDGEVFFHVKRDTLKPFVVHALNADIMVLGTSFNVHTLSENEIVKLDVLSGRVRFGSANTAVSAVVKAGESMNYNKRKEKLGNKKKADTNADAWKTKQLEFSNTLLIEVVTSLKSVYGEEIIIKNKDIESLRFTANFNNKSLDQILNVIALTFNIEVKKVNGVTELYLLEEEP